MANKKHKRKVGRVGEGMRAASKSKKQIEQKQKLTCGPKEKNEKKRVNART